MLVSGVLISLNARLNPPPWSRWTRLSARAPPTSRTLPTTRSIRSGRSRSSRRCAWALSRSERPDSRAGIEIRGSEALIADVKRPAPSASPLAPAAARHRRPPAERAARQRYRIKGEAGGVGRWRLRAGLLVLGQTMQPAPNAVTSTRPLFFYSDLPELARGVRDSSHSVFFRV
jgi:hypothetical protein